MWSMKVKCQGAARDISDKTIAALKAEIGRVNGLQRGDMVTISESVGRMLALSTGRAATPASHVSVDLMVSRTKEGRRFTWTCQIEVNPAMMTTDPVPSSGGAEPPTFRRPGSDKDELPGWATR